METDPPRELDYHGRPVLVRGGEAPVRRYRGFFYGDDWDAHSQHDGTQDLARHSDVSIEYRGTVFDLHRTPSGKLHSHELPFVAFSSVEEAVEYVAAMVDRNIGDGRSEEPEQP